MPRDPNTHTADIRHEVSSSRPSGRPTKPLTAEQIEAARVRAEREEHRRKAIDTMRTVDPACEVEGDPPVAWKVPTNTAEPTGVILDLPRSSGRGLSGSRLVLASRYYDGSGPTGGEPRQSVTAFVVFRDVGGYLRRTQGVMFDRCELRTVAAALVVEADRLDLVPDQAAIARRPDGP